MNMNANSSFMSNLRGNRPATAGGSRKRGLAAADDKENLGPNVDNSLVGRVTKTSKLTRPRTAASIQQSKNKDDVRAPEPAPAPPAEPEEPAEPEHPLAVELKQSEIDYKAALAIKIKSTGRSRKDEEAKMQQQKDLIIHLRKALSDLVDKRDAIVSRFVDQHEASSAAKEEANARIAELEADVARVSAEMATGQEAFAALQAQFDTLEANHKETVELNAQSEAALVSEKAARAAEQKEAAQVRAERESVTAERDTAKSLAVERQEKLDSQQVKHESELEALRTQLGQEMVAAHENKTKFNNLSEEFAELKTKFAVMEEAWKASKAEVERLQAVEASHKESATKLQEEKDALSKNLIEMQARMDAKEQGHADAVKGMVMGQELQATRIKELEAARGEAQEEVRAAKAEVDEVQTALAQERSAAQQAGIELRLAETQLQQMTQNLEAKAAEAEAMRVEMAAIVQDKQKMSEAMAVLQTEYEMYKKQVGLQETQMDQIEKLCKAQAESMQVQAAKNATEADLLRERALVDQLKAQLDEAKMKLHKAETARRKVFNELQEVKGNIRTFCRLRPASRRESGGEGACPITMDDDNGQVLLPYNNVTNDFKFDRCFDQNSTQADVFEEVKNFVQSALDGPNPEAEPLPECVGGPGGGGGNSCARCS
jgi:kinesin family protein C1